MEEPTLFKLALSQTRSHCKKPKFLENEHLQHFYDVLLSVNHSGLFLDPSKRL